MDFLKDYAVQIIITIVLVIVLAIIIYVVVSRSRGSANNNPESSPDEKDATAEIKSIIIGENPNPQEMTETKLKDYDMIKLLFTDSHNHIKLAKENGKIRLSVWDQKGNDCFIGDIKEGDEFYGDFLARNMNEIISCIKKQNKMYKKEAVIKYFQDAANTLPGYDEEAPPLYTGNAENIPTYDVSDTEELNYRYGIQDNYSFKLTDNDADNYLLIKRDPADTFSYDVFINNDNLKFGSFQSDDGSYDEIMYESDDLKNIINRSNLTNKQKFIDFIERYYNAQ